jgi:rhodanese-related sulfurtransferase
MDPRDVYEQLHRLQLIDVRQAYEWQAGRIEAARHIPMGEIPGRLEEIDQRRPVVVVCRSGNRSGVAARALARLGYDAHNLEGGMRAWARQGLPFSTPDGRPGRVA